MTTTTEDPDFATSDATEWLIEMDRAALDEFRDGLAHCDYLGACTRLLAHLGHTEHTRAGLLLEDGPAFGTGEAPDFDVVWHMTQMTIRANLREPDRASFADLVSP